MEQKIDELNALLKELRTGDHSQDEIEDALYGVGVIDFNILIQLKHRNILFYINKTEYVSQILEDKEPIEKSKLIDVLTENFNVHRNTSKYLFDFIYACIDYTFEEADINRLIKTYCRIATAQDLEDINRLISICKALNYEEAISTLLITNQSLNASNTNRI